MNTSRTAAIALAVLLAYPFSIGPVLRIHFLIDPSSTGSPAIDSFYYPLEWLSDHSKWVSHIESLYVLWWLRGIVVP